MSTFIALFDHMNAELKWTGKADSFSAAVRSMAVENETGDRDFGTGSSLAALAKDLYGIEITEDQSALLKQDEDSVKWGEGVLIKDIQYIPFIRTAAELANLKDHWVSEGWDGNIEDEVGFEEHRDELKAWRVERDARIDAEITAKSLALAEDLGCPGNLKLSAFIGSLLSRIQRLEGQAA